MELAQPMDLPCLTMFSRERFRYKIKSHVVEHNSSLKQLNAIINMIFFSVCATRESGLRLDLPVKACQDDFPR